MSKPYLMEEVHINEEMMHEDDFIQSWDSNTPDLVCIKILQYCDQKSLLALRQVSFHWNQSIENLGCLQLHFDESLPENSTFFKRLAPRVLKVNVKCVESWTSAFTALGDNLEHLKVQCGMLSSFPTYLRSLKYLTSLTLEGESLYSTSFNFRLSTITSPVPVNRIGLTFDLDSLKALTIQNLADYREAFMNANGVGPQTIFSENMAYIMQTFRAKRLISLDITDYWTRMNRANRAQSSQVPLWEDESLLNFISVHGSQLKKLNLTCCGSFDSTGDVGHKRPIPEKLTDVLIRFRGSEGSFMNSSYDFESGNGAYWVRLLSSQKNLKRLDLASFADFPKKAFRSIIQNNSPGLTELNCCGLSLLELSHLGEIRFIDSHLRQCGSLKQLTLGLGCLYTCFDTLLEELPNSLEELEILCTRVPFSDLHRISRLPKLKSLRLIGVSFNSSIGFECHVFENDSKDYGVRMAAMKLIMRMRSLDSLEILGFQDSPTAQFRVQFGVLVQALDPCNKFGEDMYFPELFNILNVKVRMQRVISV